MTDSVPVDFAAQKQSVAEAAATKSHPERISTFAPPSPFNLTAWKQDPVGYAKKYASVVEPGRAFVSADPGAETPALVLDGPAYAEIPKLGDVTFRVKTLPFAPVSAFAEDMGTFDNGLCYITLIANSQGLADVTTHAGPGVTNLFKIQCASPAASGVVQATVNVIEARK
jgi:hypothetical protein